MSVDSRLKAYQALAEGRLDALLPASDTVPARLHEAMRYSVLAPGKRLRPALAMASAEAVGGDVSSALDAGCAAELIHCFSLIHDDLPEIDDDDLRRGRPTCHKMFGSGLAILAGDALFALAFETAATIDASDKDVRRVFASLAKATGSLGLVGGEVLDIESEGTVPDLELLKTIHDRKTGALITASCLMGGILAGADSGQLAKLESYGQAVGLAFQIADDVLNETSTPEELGKAVGSDKELGKQTYPALMGLERAREEARIQRTEAIRHLGGLPGDASGLHELADFSIDRTN